MMEGRLPCLPGDHTCASPPFTRVHHKLTYPSFQSSLHPIRNETETDAPTCPSPGRPPGRRVPRPTTVSLSGEKKLFRPDGRVHLWVPSSTGSGPEGRRLGFGSYPMGFRMGRQDRPERKGTDFPFERKTKGEHEASRPNTSQFSSACARRRDAHQDQARELVASGALRVVRRGMGLWT